MFREVPAPGFKRISGEKPPNFGAEQRYTVQLRMGWCDMANQYTASQLNWIHDGSGGDIVAVKWPLE